MVWEYSWIKDNIDWKLSFLVILLFVDDLRWVGQTTTKASILLLLLLSVSLQRLLTGYWRVVGLHWAVCTPHMRFPRAGRGEDVAVLFPSTSSCVMWFHSFTPTLKKTWRRWSYDEGSFSVSEREEWSYVCGCREADAMYWISHISG